MTEDNYLDKLKEKNCKEEKNAMLYVTKSRDYDIRANSYVVLILSCLDVSE